MPRAGPSKARRSLPLPPPSAADGSSDEDDHVRQDKFRNAKYGPKKVLRPSAVYAKKKALAKQKVRAIYEKEKAAKEAKKIKMARKWGHTSSSFIHNKIWRNYF